VSGAVVNDIGQRIVVAAAEGEVVGDEPERLVRSHQDAVLNQRHARAVGLRDDGLADPFASDDDLLVGGDMGMADSSYVTLAVLAPLR
jgi:hypothetical protein